MTASKPSGVCPVCDRPFRLTAAGTLWPHGNPDTFPPERCDGGGQTPKEKP